MKKRLLGCLTCLAAYLETAGGRIVILLLPFIGIIDVLSLRCIGIFEELC